MLIRNGRGSPPLKTRRKKHIYVFEDFPSWDLICWVIGIIAIPGLILFVLHHRIVIECAWWSPAVFCSSQHWSR